MPAGRRRRGVSVFGAAALGIAALLCAPAPGASAQPRGQRPPQMTQAEREARSRDLFMEGSQAYDAGRLDDALSKMLEAYRLVHAAEFAFNIARVYERMGDADNAVRYFRGFLSQGHPSDADRADVERRIATMQELARRQRDQIISAPPTSDELSNEARTFYMRGVALFRRRRYEAAVQAFEAANTFARLPETQYNLGVLSERLNRIQDAIDYYREYLRLSPHAVDRAQIEAKVQTLRGRLSR